MTKHYQLFVKHHGKGPWHYVDTYTNPAVAWHAQLMSMHRDCTCKIMVAAGSPIEKVARSHA